MDRTEKRCPTCKQTKAASEFYAKPDSYDSLDWHCKACQKKYIRERYAAKFRKRPLVPEGYKRCPACKAILLRTEFYPNAGRFDGLQVYCKTCWPAYTSRRGRTPQGRDEGRRSALRAYRAPVSRQKMMARKFLNEAVAFGLIRKMPCEATGEHRGRIEAHHADYTKPLDVRWLCKRHHDEAHVDDPVMPAVADPSSMPVP